MCFFVHANAADMAVSSAIDSLNQKPPTQPRSSAGEPLKAEAQHQLMTALCQAAGIEEHLEDYEEFLSEAAAASGLKDQHTSFSNLEDMLMVPF